MPTSRNKTDHILREKSAFAALMTLIVFLVSCTPIVTRQELPIQLHGEFSETGQRQQPEKWWIEFNDPTLNQLMTQALTGNFTLQGAWDRFDRAQAVARKAGADLSPKLSGSAGYNSQRSRANSQESTSQSYSLGLTASYEIDLWGRINSNKTAAELDRQASTEDLRTAALTLSAQVAATWFQLIEQRGQIEIVKTQLQTNKQTLELINLQFRTGQVGIADLLQQRQVVESQQGELSLAAGKAQVKKNQLAVLLGVNPVDFSQTTNKDLGELPPLPETGLQSNLLERRPDIRSAWTKLQAADQRIASAVADRFPRISLTGQASTTNETIEDLFDNWLASLTANILAPIIDGGQRRAEVERTQAIASEALHNYGQTVLEALSEVDNALVQEQKQKEYLVSIERQRKLAAQATIRIRDRYMNGDVDYQRVLTAMLSEQRLQRTQLTAKLVLFENRISLCRALAGGWEMSRQREQTPLRGE